MVDNNQAGNNEPIDPDEGNGLDGDAIQAEGPDVETHDNEGPGARLSGEESLGEEELTVEDILNAVAAEEAAPSAEHLADLKRVTAEYANYRKRTEANREVERERAIGSAVSALLPVLDDLDRAEKHGDLEGENAFSTIAAKLRANVEKLGLTTVGTVGEAFDVTIHEAIFQQPTPGVEVETVADVVEKGYYLGSTLLRPAKVVVQVPA